MDNNGYNGSRGGRGNGERRSGGKPYGSSYGKPSSGERKPYNRDGGKPYGKSFDGERKPYDGERKPYNRDGGKPYGKSFDGERKPYDGERKPYNRDGGKPYGKSFDGERKPYDGERKPYNRDGGKPYGKSFDGERKPYDGERKPYNRDGGKPYGKPEDAPDTVRQQFQEDEESYLIIGRNAVREAVKTGRSIDKIFVIADGDGSIREVLKMARERNLIIREVDKKKLDELTMPFGHGGKPANHQGIVAQAAGVEYCDVQDILDVAAERNEKPFIIILDGVMDPHNLGSIIRSAECAGAHGVIIPKRRSASVTAAVVRTSAGAIEHIKVARVANLSNAIERLKQENVWIAGADMEGTPMKQAKLAGALALVIGGEGEGLSQLVAKRCDFIVSIPMTGQVGSLNASVAAAILMFAKREQDAAEQTAEQ